MSLPAENYIRKFFNKFYWRQHPEAALRYYPVVKAIKKLNLEDSKILEVGPGSLGIIPYLKREIDGVDVDFSGPKTKLLNKIKGKANNLPFAKNAYDVAIFVDVLEHLRKEERQDAIYEILRVTKRLVVIVVPVGELAQEQDKKLDEYFFKKFGRRNQYLEEHVSNGLPKTEEVLVFIDKSLRKLNKKAKVESSPNLNLFVREILMKTWITKSKFSYYLYLKGYLLFLPFLKLLNFGNCYRRVFVIELAPNQISN